MSKSYFERDLKNEQILTEWIEKNFLASETDKYEIIKDFRIQNTGVDFIMTSEKIFGYNLPYKVDFKAALTYLRPMQDEYNNRPQKMPTFAFELSFLNKTKDKREGWLFGEKYNNTEAILLVEKENYPKLHYSSFLNEKPVNLVIHTNDLEKMAIYHETITKSPNKEEFKGTKSNANSSIEHSCKLFNDGYTVNEIMEKRKLAHSTIIDHLYKGAFDGFIEPTSSFLPKNKSIAIQKAINLTGEDELSSIKYYLDEQLGADAVSYNEIKQYLIEMYSNK